MRLVQFATRCYAALVTYSEADARKIIGPTRADKLCSIIQGGWNAHIAEKRARRSRVRANVVWNYIVDAADLEFAAMPGVVRVGDDDAPIYVVDDKLALVFKKHTRSLGTSNVRTKAQRTVRSIGQFAHMPGTDAVSVGYTLDQAEAGIDKLVATHFVGNELDWWIDLRELASGVLAPMAPTLFPIRPPAPPALPPITAKPVEKETEE
jgi:hypothetical protein